MNDLIKEQKKTDLAKKPVTLSNAIVRSAWSLTLDERRLILITAAKLLDGQSRTKWHKDKPCEMTRISASDFAEIANIDIKHAYQKLKEAEKRLWNRTVYFYHQNPKTGKEEAIEKLRWTYRAIYRTGDGCIDLWWSPELMVHFYQLKKKFTKYRLESAVGLRSTYSMAMLNLIQQFENTGWLEISIEEFHHIMETTEKQRKDFNTIRRRILEPSIKELSAKDNWSIKWHPVKAGRRVTKLRFEFERKKQIKVITSVQ